MDRIAAEPTKPVLLVEGEKCADVAAPCLSGYVPAAWYGGAGKAAEVDLSPLSGRVVYLWADNDDPGRTAMDTIAQRLITERVAAEVRIIHLAKAVTAFAIEDGGDIADILDAGTPPEQVIAFLDDADNSAVPRLNALGNSAQARANRAVIDGMTAYGIQVDATGKLSQRTNVDADHRLMADDVVIDRIVNRFHVEAQTNGINVNDKRMCAGAQVIIADMARERHRDIVQHLSTGGDPATAESRVRELARIWTGQDCPLIVRVLWHWLWLVKRAMAGLPFAHDIMPILFGGQGGGKSTAAARLVSLLAELVDELNVEVLTDSRRARELAKYLIGLWDEMQGASKGDLEAIKHAITCKHRGYRPMRTNDDVQVRRTMSFIGTSNVSLAEVIPDTTGARRFFEIACLPKMDFEAVNNFDYLGLWRSVDPRSEAPILSVLDQVRMAQEETRAKDSYDLFEEAFLACDPTSTGAIQAHIALIGSLSAAELWNAYSVSFCKPYNLNPIAVNAFYRRAKERLFDMRQDTNFGRQRRYVLKPAIADALRQKLG